MHPALWKLLRLYRKASFRRLLRGARTLRGAVMLLFLVSGIGVTLCSTVVTTIAMRSDAANLEELRHSMPWNPMLHPGMIGVYLPLILLAGFLRAVLGKGGWMHLCFTPAEVEFLFPGPFHRRELLLFKLCRRGMALVLGSLLMVSTPLGLIFKDWLAAFVGATLALAFLSLSSLAATLTRLLIAEAAHTRARRALLIAAGTLAAVALPRTVSGARALDLADLVTSFRWTWPGRVLLAPFEVFSSAMLAERRFPDLAGWAAAAAAIDLALLMLVLKLDADYVEWSASISEWAYERQQTARRSGGLIAKPVRGRGPFRLPTLPWHGGAGPIAWRQLLLTHRRCRGTTRMAVTISAAVLLWNWFSSGSYPMAAITPGMVLGIFYYATFMAGTAIPLAFRGDLHHLDVLKVLPLRPLAVAVGELGGCVAVLSVPQLAFLAIYGLAARSGGWLLPAAAILAPAINWILLATGNLLFLIYPIPTTPGATADLSVAGRALWILVLQLLMLVPLLGFPAALAALAYLACGYSWPAMIATAFVLLLLEAVPMTMLIAWAFDRFDPSMDTPA